MGLFDRIGDLIDANLTTVLDRAEDPELTLNAAIREMEDTLADVRRGTVRLIAERTELAARWREAEFEMLEWDRKAELALTRGREDLARAALAAKEQVRRATSPLKQELDAVDTHIGKTAEDTRRLEAKLSDAHARRRSLAARHRSAVDRLRVRTTLYGGRIDEAMARASELDREIDALEARGHVAGMGRGPRGLAAELEELEKDERIGAELEALRSRVAAR